jgi:2-polyprenyl-3-methyl-5-hydroxy-6-metoxy-1,4-benzoquinol methylase
MLTVEFDRLPLGPGMRVLDAGCGSGRHLCAAFRTIGVEVVGMDLKEEDLRTARGTLSLLGEGTRRPWLVVRGDVTKLPFGNGSFDAVVCSEVLEHVPDHRRAIASCSGS